MPVPVELKEVRMGICKQCPELTKINRCRKCGCFMTLKITLTGAKCPLGKWPDTQEWMNNYLERN
jgi:hypothetical protein